MRKAVGLLLPGRTWLDHVLHGQFARAYTASQVEFTDRVSDAYDALVVASGSPGSLAGELERFAEKGGRVVAFGRLDERLEALAGVACAGPHGLSSGMQDADGARISKARLRYPPDSPLAPWQPWPERPLIRLDFEEAWNVYGFGKILLTDSPWGLAGSFKASGARTIAWAEDGSRSVPFMTLRTVGSGGILWVNRAAGLADTLECSLLYRFISSWNPRPGLPPFVRPIPPGYSSAVSFRFDCDEAIESARELLGMYFAAGFVPSLAVTTREIKGPATETYLKEFSLAGGAVLSHSVDHPAHWGKTYEAAFAQASGSRKILEKVVGRPVHCAVSPFHQNPPEAVKALADAGYLGLATGTLEFDPEALLGWPGFYPGPEGPVPVLLHEQKAMLHGDIVRRHGGLDHYRASFEAHRKAGVPFGYLDHPLSGYDYGWGDARAQRKAHGDWVGWLKGKPGLWKPIETELLLYLAGLQRLILERESQGGAERVRLGFEGPELLRELVREYGVMLLVGDGSRAAQPPEAGSALELAFK